MPKIVSQPSKSMFALGAKRVDEAYLKSTYDTQHSAYFEFEGVAVRYEDQGPKTAPVLLMVHGLMANLRAWDAWLERLRAEHYRLLTLDLPGWGLSDTPTPTVYDPQVHQRAVMALMDQLGIENATLIGHSYGGHVAWNLAADYPQRFTRLVIVNGLSFPQRVRLDAQLMRFSLIRQSAKRMAPRIIIEYVIYSMLYKRNSLSAAERQMYFDFLLRRGAKRTMSDAINWYLDYAKTNQQPSERLLKLQQPILTLWGERDVWVSYRDAGRAWPQAYPEQTHISYPDAGHLVVDEKPSESVQALLDFLAKHPSSSL